MARAESSLRWLGCVVSIIKGRHVLTRSLAMLWAVRASVADRVLIAAPWPGSRRVSVLEHVFSTY
jgi:hypothetical protein